ncbi:tyrosine-type recombinase/integrase [Geodermatophilus sp. SYSU D00742]
MTSRRGDPAGEPAGVLLASFRRHLRAAAKAPRTIELYGQSVRYFSRWLAGRGREPVLDELTRHAIAAWLAELAETCEPSTVGTRLRGMRWFCRWLVTEGQLEVALTDGIELPSPLDKPVPILTDTEGAALLKACAVGRGRPGVFDRARLPRPPRRGGTAAAAGHWRAGVGAVRARPHRRRLGPELAYVTGKDSRPRVVPFGAKTAQAVNRYVRVRALHPYARSPRLLLGQRGPMTSDGARDVPHARAAQAGVPDVHPHRFRQAFAHRRLSLGDRL